jgi:hypothetical protein
VLLLVDFEQGLARLLKMRKGVNRTTLPLICLQKLSANRVHPKPLMNVDTSVKGAWSASLFEQHRLVVILIHVVVFVFRRVYSILVLGA